MKAETEWMEGLLPDDYICEQRENGVHCHSTKGIADDKGLCDHWDLICKAIKQKFGDRFMEIFYITMDIMELLSLPKMGE